MSYPLSEVMDAVASLLNDTAKTDYTYAAQLPYVKIALAELQEEFELNNIPVTNETSSAIVVVAGVETIDFTTTPALPSDLIEIQQAWERLSGSADPYIPLSRMEFLPHYLQDEQVDQLTYWAWINQQMKFLGATTDRDLKLDYIASIFPNAPDENSQLTLINGKTFLQYRGAALCAEFVGENVSRAKDLNQYAVLALDRALGIPTKGRQATSVRRKPFRASYRTRSYW